MPTSRCWPPESELTTSSRSAPSLHITSQTYIHSVTLFFQFKIGIFVFVIEYIKYLIHWLNIIFHLRVTTDKDHFYTMCVKTFCCCLPLLRVMALARSAFSLQLNSLPLDGACELREKLLRLLVILVFQVFRSLNLLIL